MSRQPTFCRTSSFWCLLLAVAGGLAVGAAGALADPGPTNLTANAGFEQAAGDMPDGWKPRTWAGEGEFAYPAAGRDGGRGVGIASSQGGDLSWSAEVPVEPNGLYRLSGWIRTENLARGTGRGALLNVHQMGRGRPCRVQAGAPGEAPC